MTSHSITDLAQQKVAAWLRQFPDANTDILSFIATFILAGGTGDAEQETLRITFRAGYCYYFAVMLKTAFPDGEICWAAPFGHIVFVHNDIPYDIEGIYCGESDTFIQVDHLGDAILDFQHIPNKTYNASEEEIKAIIRKYAPANKIEQTLQMYG